MMTALPESLARLKGDDDDMGQAMIKIDHIAEVYVGVDILNSGSSAQ